MTENAGTVVVARPLNGTCLNGLEFLLTNDRADYMKFDTKEEAKAFLEEHAFPGATDEELENYFTFMTPEEAMNYEINSTHA